jgi:regulator of sigma E protease
MPTFLFYTLTFVVALAVLIVVHEFGHFILAKRLGVRVLRFSVGIGPVIFSRRIGETEYALSAIPVGGYVKMLGEDDDTEGFDPAESGRAFSARPVGHRALIVAAGPVFNFIFAILVYIALHLFYGVATPSELPRVAGTTPGMPAEKAGLTAGDLITAVDGAPVTTWEGLAQLIRDSGGRTLDLTVERAGQVVQLPITPERRQATDLFGEPTGETYLIGVVRDTELSPVPVHRAVYLGVERATTGVLLVFEGLYRMVTGRISARELGGPIAIARTAGEQARQGLGPFLNALGFLSINLAVLNVLPIPVLDGGHLFFFLLEALLRRPIRQRHREIAQQMGLLILVTLMLFVFYNDIHRLLEG